MEGKTISLIPQTLDTAQSDKGHALCQMSRKKTALTYKSRWDWQKKGGITTIFFSTLA